MFLKQSRFKNGKVFLSIVHGFRENGSTKQRTIEKIGYLDDLSKSMDDPVSFYKKRAELLTIEYNQINHPIDFSFDKNEKLINGTQRKNLGYSALQCIYHQLDISGFFLKYQRNTKAKYNLNNIFRLLVYSRILTPGSKKHAFSKQNYFFEGFKDSLDDIYRSLDIFEDCKDDLLSHIHSYVSKEFPTDSSLAYYDVTNYYFEIDEPDELRKKGVSKEHRKTPIVQMGLLMDSNGIPLSYNIFPGNQSEKTSLQPILKKTRRTFNLDKIVVVADRGLNTSDNIVYNVAKGDGYIYSQTIRGSNKEMKEYVLKQEDYNTLESGFKYKSRLYSKEVTITCEDGRKIKKNTAQKQVIFYSSDYDRRAKNERNITVNKAKNLIDNPGQYTNANAYGASKYLKDVEYDKKTGEIIKSHKRVNLDIDKIMEEEKYDGYYAIVTSELNKSDMEIIEAYRGLWKIEESFKITKSEFKSRPVYLSREKHIKAHFLTCYVSLVLIRILEKKLENKYSIKEIIKSLNNYSCSHIKENYYLFDYRDEIIEDIEKLFDIDLSKKIQSRQEIKNILAKTKIM